MRHRHLAHRHLAHRHMRHRHLAHRHMAHRHMRHRHMAYGNGCSCPSHAQGATSGEATSGGHGYPAGGPGELR
jgi:hypothetical protein